MTKAICILYINMSIECSLTLTVDDYKTVTITEISDLMIGVLSFLYVVQKTVDLNSYLNNLLFIKQSRRNCQHFKPLN